LFNWNNKAKLNQDNSRAMLEKSLETLAYTIDTRDKYSEGHSSRVAKYSKLIAEFAQMSDEFCNQVYLAGLVHDIGMVSVSEETINKKDKLAWYEYEEIKKHPVNGAVILKGMQECPYLIEGAKYHHERYDGGGYPEGLKDNDIPEIARIIAVADAYDAMTSYRSYRLPMDQAEVKQEIWMGAGTQFDPYFAKIMIALIDADLSYEMRENPDVDDNISLVDDAIEIMHTAEKPVEIKADNQMLQETSIFTLGQFASGVKNWENPAGFIHITEKESQISFISTTNEDAEYLWYVPSVIIYSSNDGSMDGEDYDEFAVFASTGYSWKASIALKETSKLKKKKAFENWEQWTTLNRQGMKYSVSAKRKGNTVKATIDTELLSIDASVVLPNSFNQDLYFAITGERCSISNIE